VISGAENSNKFQKTRFWKEKSVEDVVTLGPAAQATLVTIKWRQYQMGVSFLQNCCYKWRPRKCLGLECAQFNYFYFEKKWKIHRNHKNFLFFHFLENVWPSWKFSDLIKALKGRPLVIFLKIGGDLHHFGENISQENI
jgi:hypothetical protein